jgi:hypothetical protein
MIAIPLRDVRGHFGLGELADGLAEGFVFSGQRHALMIPIKLMVVNQTPLT